LSSDDRGGFGSSGGGGGGGDTTWVTLAHVVSMRQGIAGEKKDGRRVGRCALWRIKGMWLYSVALGEAAGEPGRRSINCRHRKASFPWRGEAAKFSATSTRGSPRGGSGSHKYRRTCQFAMRTGQSHRRVSQLC
jgi:hypothetical protein